MCACYSPASVLAARVDVAVNTVNGPDPSDNGQKGVISAVLPNALFDVTLESGHKVRCHVGGVAKVTVVKLHQGDRVRVIVSSRNNTRGRITGRTED